MELSWPKIFMNYFYFLLICVLLCLQETFLKTNDNLDIKDGSSVIIYNSVHRVKFH